jgi:ArsR family transcriptional regulator, arsenate/arsenite/antimonite-responsive transcriptional repressor
MSMHLATPEADVDVAATAAAPGPASGPVRAGACCDHVDGVCSCVDCACPSLLTTTLDEVSATALAAGFAALADPVRLRLVSLMATSPDGMACVCDLIAPLGKSQSTVSHHLKVLADAGLVRGEKSGRLIAYRLVDARLGSLRTALAKEGIR